MATVGFRTWELCESGGGRPRLPVPNSPYGLCGRKAALKLSLSELRSCVKVEVAVPCSPYGLCGRKATLNLNLGGFIVDVVVGPVPTRWDQNLKM